jgi:flagellin
MCERPGVMQPKLEAADGVASGSIERRPDAGAVASKSGRGVGRGPVELPLQGGVHSQMSLRINTNVNAMNALRNLEQTSFKVANSIERLSSGLRINRAADDPAGLIISESLRAQIDGLNQAVSNAQDASNLIKTAEGGLQEVNSLLRSIRQLAVHAANTGVNDSTAVQADQTQIKSAIESIDRIASQTQYGNKNLLDGTAGITASVIDTARLNGVNLGATFGGYVAQSGNVTITVNNSATRAQSVGTATYANINSSLSLVGGGTTGAGGTVVVNGQSIVVSGSETVQTLINKINNLASVTGVSADFTAGNGSGAIVLKQQSYGANFSIVQAESARLINGTSGTSVAGLNATVTVQAQTLVNGAVTSTTATFVGGRSSTDSGLRATDTYGNSILLSEQGNTNTSTATNVARVSASNLQFQIGGNGGQYVSASLGNVGATNLGTTAVAGINLSSIDVTTSAGASNALSVIDEAISSISTLRANLGSLQKNTLDVTIRFLGIGVENLSASESQIRDTNVAQEVVALTKNQVLQQAGTSVLAQANASPQSVLSLLR